jgi:hypothetical protein
VATIQRHVLDNPNVLNELTPHGVPIRKEASTKRQRVGKAD